ncbi:MAG: MMPL family transporter [Clostridiales Family XIII bacterium]|jgi:predicted RND superfamily exporter protein|nr:MMPL family transporter [Clostridiales Family XIII bacterium]
MQRFADTIITHRRKILVLFIVAAIACAPLILFVKVNHDLTDYLPPQAPSTRAVNVMLDEFGQGIPNATLEAKDVSIAQALEMKRRLSDIGGIRQILWLDDVVDVRQPLGMADSETVEGFYKDGTAKFTLTIDDGMARQVSASVKAQYPEAALGGEAMDAILLAETTDAEVLKVLAILLPLILIILCLSTSSWLEPLLFLIVIGVAILVNMGTNYLLGGISFVTLSVSPILQLACSLDYAVFLLHSFSDNRKIYDDPKVAMRHAIRESLPTVGASAATTLFGFLALVFMNFGIGADLGLNLVKGILLSFLSVMFLLPALALCTFRLLDRTRHRELLPGIGRIGKHMSKAGIAVVAIVLLVAVPCFLGQGRTEFTYSDGMKPSASADDVVDKVMPEEGSEPGDSPATVIALLVPRGDVAREQVLADELEKLQHVTGIVSYVTQVGGALPAEFLTEDIAEQFYSEHYARFIVYTDTEVEGSVAFETAERVQDAAYGLYGDAALAAGQSVNLYDMSHLVETDNLMVSLIAVISIFLVLLVTFRSAIIPCVLLFTIEAAIWINLSIPYFQGRPINFLGYLVLSAVQLGTTVDYAILLTNTWLRYRRQLPKREATIAALADSFRSILVSAAVLAAAGFTLFTNSSNPAISEIGMLLGRGTLLSLLMVVCFLPAVLNLLDGAIGKVTWHAKFVVPAPRLPERNIV